MNSEESAELVRRALAGDQIALNRLVSVLTPVIQTRVARTLFPHRSLLAAGRNLHQEVEDQTQEVFLMLFARDGRTLRSWQPEGGLSLESFVDRVAECQVLSFLRKLQN
jgi:DNA-directed RNA polymerase specialized sigma24 family protein